MNSMEVDPSINTNTPLVRIIIPELDAQQILNNTSNIQMDPLVKPPNIVVDDIGDITLEPSVGPHTIINTSAPQVVDSSPLSLKDARSKKSIEDDLDFNHAPISQYLRCPRPSIPKVPMGSRLVIMAVSMNCLPSPIENSSTCQIIRREKPIIQTIISFIGEHNYE
jgi:hypothetical protein